MKDNNPNEKNRVTIEGRVISEPVFSHEVYGEKFYNIVLTIPRLNVEVQDKIIVSISDRMLDIESISIGNIYHVEGQFRSFNKRVEGMRAKLILTVFAREIEEIDEEQLENTNSIYLEGYICKEPIYRTTPKGREICDVLLAVNRPYGKSDYLPCITWGRNAMFSSNLSVGTGVTLEGRIQSRVYTKKLDEENSEERTAYEVSVSKISVFSDPLPESEE